MPFSTRHNVDSDGSPAFLNIPSRFRYVRWAIPNARTSFLFTHRANLPTMISSNASCRLCTMFPLSVHLKSGMDSRNSCNSALIFLYRILPYSSFDFTDFFVYLFGNQKDSLYTCISINKGERRLPFVGKTTIAKKKYKIC